MFCVSIASRYKCLDILTFLAFPALSNANREVDAVTAKNADACPAFGCDRCDSGSGVDAFAGDLSLSPGGGAVELSAIRAR